MPILQNKPINQRRFIFFIYCTIIGFLANMCAVTLPIAVPLTLGNVTILVILARLGPLWGCLSFIIVVLPLGEELLILLSGLQALLFLIYYQYRKGRMLTFAAIYLLLAAFLCWFKLPETISNAPYLLFLYVLLSSAVFLWTIKAANMLLAMSVRPKILRQQSLQHQLSYRFGLYTAIPAALLIALGLNGITSITLVKKMADYQAELGSLKHQIELRLFGHVSKAETVAGLLETQRTKQALKQLVLQEPEFISALITDNNGTVTEFFKADVENDNIIGSSVQDRAYFFEVRAKKINYISNTFTGRAIGTDQLFAVSVPIFEKDEFAGIVQIAIKLDSLLEVFPVSNASKSHQILIDSAGKKIWGNNIDGDIGSFWQRPKNAEAMEQRMLENSIFNPLDSILISKDAHHFIMQNHIDNAGWSLHYLIDTEATVLTFFFYLAVALSLITLILEASVLLSKRFVSHYTRALEQLVDYTQQWDGKTPNQSKPEFVQSAREIDTLTDSFINMQRRVAGAHHAIVASMQEVRVLNSELEQRVEQRTHELELERDKANHLAAVKTRFLANMSHEIRTPITIIKGFTEQLIDCTDGTIRQQLRRIQHNTEHLHNVVNDILDVAKMDAGKMSFAPIAIPALSLLEEIADSLKQLSSSKQLITELKIDLAAELTVWADPFRLKQIMLNLVSNAVKFTSQGQICLTANITDGNIHISVADQGIGIAADKIPKLFQAFAQADSSISRDYGGTGLGLFISKQLADAMGMEMVVSSEVDQGSTFTLIIPAKLISVSTHLDTAINTNEISTPANSNKGKKVLIVDDVQDIRDLIAAVLCDSGLILSFAQDGVQALNLVQQQAFDLVIMDQQMPKMDGLTAAAKMRQLGFNLPLVQLSADVFTEKTELGPFNCALVKPIDKQALIQTLNRLLGMNLTQKPGNSLDIENDLSKEYKLHLKTQTSMLSALAAQQELTKLASELHKIKGTASSLGFIDIANAASAAEQKIKQHNIEPDLLAELIKLINDE